MRRLVRLPVHVLVGVAALGIGCQREEQYHGRPLSHWVAALRNPDPAVRAEAVDAITESSPRSAATVNLLLDALAAERDTSLHPAFAGALSRLGAASVAAVPRLTELLRDEHTEIREAAASALGNIGSAASPAVPELARALRDCCHDVRASAAEALGRMGPAAAAAVPALVEALEDPISWVRLKSADALIAIGPTSREAAVGLTKSLGDRREDVRVAAAAGLSGYGSSVPDAIPVLRRMVTSDPFPTVRIAAANALGAMVPASRSALPDLMTAQRDSDFAVRRAVRDAIARIGVTP